MDAAAWAILLLLLGLFLLVLEFFVPSAGVLAVMCGLSLIAAIIVGFTAGPWMGLSILLTVCILVPAAAVAAVTLWPKTPIGRMILIPRPPSADAVLPDTVAYRGLKELVGRRGVAKGLMLPSGLVIIDGKTYDAVSEGMPIDPGQSVLVVGVSTQRLVVRPDTAIRAEMVDSQPAAAQTDPNQPLVGDIPDPFAE